MQTSHRNRQAAICLFILIAYELASAQQPPPEGTTFEVVSVRAVSSKEAADRSPDFVGPNVAVRLRLTTAFHSLNFYTWKNVVIPTGYKIEQTERGIVWLRGNAGTEKKESSPGLRAVLFGSAGEWMTLPPFSSIEWEELDSTMFAGKKHAFTIFLRGQDKDQPKEVTSGWFVVPQDNSVGTTPERKGEPQSCYPTITQLRE